MTDLSAEYKALAEYRPTNKVRFVTAASLFDGHDAAINIMRRILHGHGRGSDPPRPQPLASMRSSPRRCRKTCRASPSARYQGGHVEYFKYMVELLRAPRRAGHPSLRRRRRCHRAGGDSRTGRATAWRASSAPRTDSAWGWQGMIGEMVMRCDVLTSGVHAPKSIDAASAGSGRGGAGDRWRRLITALENGQRRRDGLKAALTADAAKASQDRRCVGVTGTGGAGKSSA